jgi:hypothetical protein
MSRADVKEYLKTIIVTTNDEVELATDLELKLTYDIIDASDDIDSDIDSDIEE